MVFHYINILSKWSQGALLVIQRELKVRATIFWLGYLDTHNSW
jgi:hypothetical protein